MISTFTIPVDQLWHEVRQLLDPPPPFAPEAYLQQAQLSVTQGDLDRAEALATIAMRLAPDAHAHNVRGVILARQSRWADALREFDAAVGLDPEMTEALMNRARAHAAGGEQAAARRDAERVRELAPRDSAMAGQAAEFLRSLEGSTR